MIHTHLTSLLPLALFTLLLSPLSHVRCQNQLGDMPCTAATLLQQTLALGRSIESNLVTIPYNGLSRMRELMFSLEHAGVHLTPTISYNDLSYNNVTGI